MQKHAISIHVAGQQFSAEAKINHDKLDNQVELEGVFILSKLTDGDRLLAGHAIHSTNNGTSHVLRFPGLNKAYRFKMKSGSSLDFTAVRSDINPATGKPAFEC